MRRGMRGAFAGARVGGILSFEVLKRMSSCEPPSPGEAELGGQAVYEKEKWASLFSLGAKRRRANGSLRRFLDL
jgi:hypothetical protein